MATALMTGKRGLIMGVANDHSIAWGVARTLAAHGAELAFAYQGDSFGRRVAPLAASVGSSLLVSADVTDSASMDAAFEQIAADWGRLDFVVHAIAYSDKNELKGRYVNTSRDNFLHSMEVSCYSFTDVARRAMPLMTDGGSLISMTYLGSERVLPNYNVMGVAKAALEASVRYLAADLGPQNIRVNAVSPGPMRTLAGSAVGSARKVFKHNAENAPLRRNVTLDEVGGTALFLLSDLGGGVTGETIYVDSGYNVMGMPTEENLLRGRFMAINPRDRQPVNTPPPQHTQAMLAGLFIIGFAYLLGSWWTAVFLAIAVAWHEYGHVRAFRQTGRHDATFYLLPFIGGVATSRHPHENDQDAAYVALMGPGFSLVLLLICAVFYEWAINAQDLFWAQMAGRVGYLMTIVGALNLLNLVPLWPMDGGHVFHALVRSVAPQAARTATLIAGGAVAGLAFLGGAMFIGAFAAIMVAQGAASPNLYVRRAALRPRQALVLLLAYVACLIAHFMAGRWQLISFLPRAAFF